MTEREPYAGTTRKLVLAFDVGTTYSGISYSILDPGDSPVINDVTRFPATDRVGGNSKIPTIVYYDKEGNSRAFGGEALQEAILERAEEEEWVRAEWWKLHLRPRNIPSFHVDDLDINPLPPFKNAIDILADFLGYLFRCARMYIEESHANGRDVWTSFGDNIDFVLSHPNGWKGLQHAQIRRAAVQAGLVPDRPEGQARIRLVTEGEANLHYCLASRNTANGFKDDVGVMVIDAGRATIDITSYYMTSSASPPTLHEIAPPQCLLQGSAFVTQRAGEYLREKLQGSRFGTEEDIALMKREFDKTTRLRFSNPNHPSFIRFGTVRDKDLEYNIRSGQLKLPGNEVAALFEPSAEAIIAAVEDQRRVATQPISHVFLVGDFGASDWLFSRLKDQLEPLGLQFCRPDSYTNKAVAQGAVAFYLDHRVSARVAQVTYGTRCTVEFNRNDEEHLRRAASAFPHPSGCTVIPNAFSTILRKGALVSETKEFRKFFIVECPERNICDTIAMEILCYRGNSPNPRWADSEPGMFSSLCTVHADTSRVSKTLIPRRSFAGMQFYRQRFSIVLKFGLIDLEAQISWVEDGEEHRYETVCLQETNWLESIT
ncbi:hypothetical protein EDC04DRAFT_3057215 [Pisolithus marmoratus]|nr:hypothetical protein EDC04DRAFT_3057215 [Pisolithus marmoratus]